MKLRYLLAALLLWTGQAIAAVTGNNFVTPQTPVSGFFQFTSASSAASYQTILTGGTNGTKVSALLISSSETATTHPVYCSIFHSTTSVSGTQSSVVVTATPGGTGSFYSVPVNMLLPALWSSGLPLDSDGNPYIFIAANDTLQCAFATAISSGTFLSVYAFGGNY